MASIRPSLSTRRGGNLQVGSDINDGISLLDVLYANEFEGEPDDAVADKEVEVNFYRGSQAKWRNFYLAEQPGPDGRVPVWIKRDGYDDLRKRILRCRTGRMTFTLKLLHQPGSGGTTLAMQLLWDLRTTLRCAILTSPTADKDAIAKQVICLFTAGGRGNQNTVLLLMDDEKIVEELQDSIRTEMAERKIRIYMPVVIILNCVRKTNDTENCVRKTNDTENCVRKTNDTETERFVVKTSLSEAEILRFEEKQVEISQRYRREHTTFHGFNIMRTDFSQAYVRQACANDLKLVRKNKRPRKHQLLAFIAQMNAYVPGSFFLQSQCQEFLGPPDPIHGGPSFEQRMEPFTHLIVTSSSRPGQDNHVSMAHPMIAQQWVKCFENAGVTRSDTARNLLQYFCGHETPPSLMSFIKDMLTKREQQAGVQVKFSRLIQDIMGEGEGFGSCRSVLAVASNKFKQNPFFPQTLARLLYINKYYPEAEQWAIEAKTRDPNNSFIADTLGQVRKNDLRNTRTPREMLQVAQKAIDAFKDVERAAEREQGADMKGDGTTKVSHIFNNRGLFGYLKVANVLFDKLTLRNLKWKKVLTMESPIEPFILSIEGDSKLLRYKLLILSLRDEVETKCEFFFQYITYSKPGILKDEPHYFLKDIRDCYDKYVGKCKPRHSQLALGIPFQRLKEEMAFTFPGLLSSIEWGKESLSLRRIATKWKEVAEKGPDVNFSLNFILANVMLSNVEALSPLLIPMVTLKDKLRMCMEEVNRNDTPEFYLLALLLFWPESEREEELDFNIDVNGYIQLMQSSYETRYKMYFRSRYLRSLFFLGKGGGFDRLVHSTVIDNLVKSNHWTDSELWESTEVQEKLLKMNGEVKNYRVITQIGGEDIQLDAHLPGSIWKHGRVSFYLGFNIRGPEAFGIHYSPEHQTTETKTPTDNDQTSST